MIFGVCSRPPNLRGLRVATKEPWATDEAFYQKKTGSFEHEFNSREKYDDRSSLSVSKGYTAETTSTGLKGVSQPAWDSSPMRSVPHALKGIKPVTREPWSIDAQINRNMDLEGCAQSRGGERTSRDVSAERLSSRPPSLLTRGATARLLELSRVPVDTFSAKVENDSVAGNMAYWNAQQ